MEIRINNIRIKIDHKFRFIIATVTFIIYLIMTFQGEYIYYRLHPDLYSVYTAEISSVETETILVGHGIRTFSDYATFIYTYVKINEEQYKVKHKIGDAVGEKISVAVNKVDKSRCTRNEYLIWSYNYDVSFYEPIVLFAAICLYIVWFLMLMRDSPEAGDIDEEVVDARLYNLEQAVVHNKKENKNYLTFARNFYTAFQKPLPDELSWIFRWNDLSQFDASFLYEADMGNYALVEETRKARELGLPEDYVIFRRLGDIRYAICFEDEKVYSFDIQRIDELEYVGAFYIYIIDYLEGRLTK